MKKITMISFVSVLALAGASVWSIANAQMMGGYYNNNGYASGYMMGGYNQATTTWTMSSEEAAGYAIVQKLQSKTLACTDLSQDSYESLGEYYMGLMMGSSHESMDQYIEKTYGTDYLRQMHIAMGERFSGCNTNVQFPAGMMGFGPMMGVYNWSNGYQNQGNGNWSGYSMMGWGGPGMMSGYFGYGVFSWVTMVLVWVLLIIGIIAAVKWLKNK